MGGACTAADPLPQQPCPVCPHLAERFEPFRQAAYWKRKALGFTQPIISRIENGKRSVSASELARIAGGEREQLGHVDPDHVLRRDAPDLRRDH